MNDDTMLSFAEVGRRLGISGHMVADLVRLGELASFIPGEGKQRRIWESEVSRYRLTKREIRELCEVSKTHIVDFTI